MSPRCYIGLVLAAWLFVLAVTLYDVEWAIRYHDTASLWESNPIMLWVMTHYGVWTASAGRLATVLFAAALMPLAPRRSQITATLTLTSVHVYLAVTYALIICNPISYRMG